MNRIQDVAVLGAGIAGSSLAKSLADRGWEAVLIDRKQFPRHKVCGEFFSPESRSMLKHFGLLDDVEALQPSMINKIRLIFNYGDPLEIPLPDNAIGISRYSLDSTLHSAALRSGVHVKTSTTVESVTPHQSGFRIETKHSGERKTYYARAVIAAWGANARSGLPGFNPNRTEKNTYIGVKSHFKVTEMEPIVELYFFDGGYLGIAPIEDGLINVAALLKRNDFRHNEKTVLGLIDSACRRNSKLYQKLSNAVPISSSQAAIAPVVLNRKPLAWEMIPHVGDASLMLPPLCGDGMSMALRSAQLCAPLADGYLSGDLTFDKWKDEYSHSIQREFKGPLKWGRLLQWLLDVPAMPRLLLGTAHLTPGLVDRLVQATRLKESNL